MKNKLQGYIRGCKSTIYIMSNGNLSEQGRGYISALELQLKQLETLKEMLDDNR